MTAHPNAVKTCPRCGVRRQVNISRWEEGQVCTDCKSIDPRFGKPQMGRPPMPTQFTWDSDEQIRAAHAHWTYGYRSPRINEGHRLYMREHKRIQRARQPSRRAA